MSLDPEAADHYGMAGQRYIKDPEARLPYSIDWTEPLGPGDALLSAVWTIEGGPATPTLTIVEDSSEICGAVASVWLEGGGEGDTYRVECLVTAESGRVDERHLIIAIVER